MISWRKRSDARAADALPIGLRADGHELTVPVGWHALIAGLSGSGKSTTIRALLFSAAPIVDLAVLLVDVKRVESRPWRPRASAAAVTQAEAVTLLSELLDEVGRRYELLEHLRRVDWTTDLGPRVLLVVDELAGIVATGNRTDRHVVSLIRQLLERGRAAGVTVVLATQRPSADVIPTSIRDLTALRIAHATADLVSTKMILAEGAELGPAHLLPVDDAHRGRCWAILDGTRVPVQARSYWVTVDEADAQARRYAHLRVTWNLSGAGLAAPTTNATNPTPCPWPAPVPPSSAPTVLDLTTEANTHHRPEATPREQLSAAKAVAPFTGPDTDEALLLAALAHGPATAADLRTRTGLPEGRCRRARQYLERTQQIVATTNGYRIA